MLFAAIVFSRFVHTASQRRYDHIWSSCYSENDDEMTETGDDWDDFIDHDVKTLVERGDVEKAYIRASGPLVR